MRRIRSSGRCSTCLSARSAGSSTVALTFLATQHGLSISEGALLNGAQMLTQWLKWLWAPVVDVTLTPRKWYVLSTALSAVGVLAMAAVPLGPGTLGAAPRDHRRREPHQLRRRHGGRGDHRVVDAARQVGRVSAWFQAGNLGGAGLGGALGLFLVTHLPRPWMGGADHGRALHDVLRRAPLHAGAHALHAHTTSFAAVKGVVRDLEA